MKEFSYKGYRVNIGGEERNYWLNIFKEEGSCKCVKSPPKHSKTGIRSPYITEIEKKAKIWIDAHNRP
jgi:hypothetical protein